MTPLGTYQRLNLKYEPLSTLEPVSNVAFNVKLRPCTWGRAAPPRR